MEPNWIVTTAVGTFAGFLLPYLIQFISYLVHSFRKSGIVGNWFIYHVTYLQDSPLLESGILSIKKGYSNQFIIVSKEHETTDKLIYKGRLSFERNHWLIRMKAANHDEEVSIRLLSPILTADSITWGLFLSLDFRGEPIAGPVVLSRKSLSRQEVLALMLQKTKLDQQTRTLSI